MEVKKEERPPGALPPPTVDDRWLNVLNVGVLYDVDFFLRLSASYELGP